MTEEKVETAEASADLAQARAAGDCADGEDVALVTVAVTDIEGRIVPVANNQISFSVEGGTIIGVVKMVSQHH